MVSSSSNSSCSNWQQRSARNMSSNVVQTICNRELGFPFFSRSSETMSNESGEKAIARQLVGQRLSSLSLIARIPEEVKIDAKPKPKSDRKSERVPQGWVKLVIGKNSTIQYFAEIFWVVTTINAGGFGGNSGRNVYKNTFYKMESDLKMGFTKFESCNTVGKLVDSDIMSFRALESISTVNPTYLVTLTNSGQLTAFNVSSIQFLKQPTSISLVPFNPDENSPCPTVHFSDLFLDFDQKLVGCLASAGGQAKSITFMHFPPIWTNQMVLGFETRLSALVVDSIVLLADGKKVDFFSMASLIDNSQEKEVPKHLVKRISRLRVVKAVPEEPLVSCRTTSNILGLLESNWPPLYYRIFKNELSIHQLMDETPIWSCPFLECIPTVSPFPDASHAALFTVGLEQFVISWTKKTDFPASYEFKKITPFKLHEEKSGKSSVTSQSPRRWPRACHYVNKYTLDLPTQVLALDYSEMLDQFVVCTYENADLHVNLYHTKTFQLFKLLPPIKQNRIQGRGTEYEDDLDNAPKLYDIKRVTVSFDFQVIMLSIDYMSGAKEVFVLRTCEENVSVNI